MVLVKLLDTALRSIINQGDEILIPGPVYAGYIPLIQTLGGIPVFIDTTESSFKLTPELIESHITQKYKSHFAKLSNQSNWCHIKL